MFTRIIIDLLILVIMVAVLAGLLQEVFKRYLFPIIDKHLLGRFKK